MKYSRFISVFITSLIYFILALVCLNHCYFWDMTQQISKEAHWFYLTDFSTFIIPSDNVLGIASTGYHPPLMPLLTAFLWKIFGCRLFVSHLFILIWAVLLIYHSWKLLAALFPREQAQWIFTIVLLEPVVLTQFAVSSTDFILLTAFVMSVRAILERKTVLLSAALIFLCGISMRGVFTGAVLFVAHCFYSFSKENEERGLKLFFKVLIPYLPVVVLLTVYYLYYFSTHGWFFTRSDYSGHYMIPHTFGVVMHNLAALVLKLIENGRIIIWLITIYFIGFFFKKKIFLFSPEEKFLGVFSIGFFLLYFLFVFITQMPFSPRYFIPLTFSMTLLISFQMIKYWKKKTLKTVYLLILFFTVTGHFWIYPEKMSKSWDCILTHLPYYELREKCFDYIDETQMNYEEIGSGFCLYGNRGYTELKNYGKIINNDLNNKYFIYSNISNLEDNEIDELKDRTRWQPIRKFEQWPVFITIYRKIK